MLALNENVRITMDNGTLKVTAPLTSKDANSAAYSEIQKMNNGRVMPHMTRRQRAATESDPVYIYNVSPRSFTRHMGTTGTFTIKACPPDAKYSDPIVLPGMLPEPIPKDETAMVFIFDDGDYVAQQILGIGPHLKPRDSLVHEGCFYSFSNPPLKQEIDDATKKYRDRCQKLVKEANDAHALGPNKRNEVVTDEHFAAARYLGYSEKDCGWMQGSAAPANRETCPGCGNGYIVGIHKCANGSCGYILDRPAYEKAVLAGDYGDIVRESLVARKAK